MTLRRPLFAVLLSSLWLVLFALGIVGRAQAQAATADYLKFGTAIPAAQADPAIAAALQQISADRIKGIIEKLVSFGTRSSLSSMAADLPAGQGVTAAADWIAGQFEEISNGCGHCLEVKRDTFTASGDTDPQWAGRVPHPTTMTNVYAVLHGSDPAAGKRMYLVTGHYDSRNSNTLDFHGAAPGANDDASGVAVSLECARVLSKLHLPASLVFVAVAGEEQGLIGSSHLAKLAKAEGWQLEGVLNNDIVGGNTTPGDTGQRKVTVRVFSEGIPATATAEQTRKIRAIGSVDDAPSRQLARAMAEAGRTYLAAGSGRQAFAPTLVSRPDRYLRGGDHTSFNREGFAAVRITEWREDFNHQHQNIRVENGVQFGDLLQFVDFAYVAEVARLNAATLATLAASPGIPAEVGIATEKLENGTTLHWKAPEGAAAGLHYELVWRATDAAGWERMLPVEPDTAKPIVSITVPISKDNVIFGVRAVDAAGHRGLVATP